MNEETIEKKEGLSPAVDVAHDLEAEDSDIVVLTTGVRAKLLPVPVALIEEVTGRVRDPKVPEWFNEDKGRKEPNPVDPDYVAALQEAERQRNVAAMDALILFGIELLDPIPQDRSWLRKLRYLGIDVDEDDPFAVDFAYKKYVATTANDISLISRLSGVRQEDIDKATKSFRGNKTRRAN